MHAIVRFNELLSAAKFAADRSVEEMRPLLELQLQATDQYDRRREFELLTFELRLRLEGQYMGHLVALERAPPPASESLGQRLLGVAASIVVTAAIEALLPGATSVPLFGELLESLTNS